MQDKHETAWSALQRFRRDSDGVAAVEFALIAPILIIFLFGVFELGRAYSAHRRFLSATYMIGDLVTREKQVTLGTCPATQPVGSECLRGIYKLVKPALAGFASDTTTLSIQVTPVHMPDPVAKPNDVRVYATPESLDLTSKPACGAVNVTADVKNVLKSSPLGLVLVKATYQFKPIFSYPMIGNMTWSYETAVAPRQECVAFVSGSTSRSCASPCS